MCYWKNIKVLSYWNVSVQLRINLRKWSNFICCQSVLHEELHTFFHFCRNECTFCILTVVSKRKGLKIAVPEVTLTFFYEMFCLQPNIWQSTRIVKLSVHTTWSRGETMGNFNSLTKTAPSFAPESNDALIFRESVLTFWVNIAMAATCISSSLLA